MQKVQLLVTCGLGWICLLTACQPSPPEVEKQLRQIRVAATRFVLSEQGKDGGWHSNTHGILRGGQAYTPYVIDALMGVEEFPTAREHALARGFAFLRESLDTAGVLGRTGFVLEYPVYATALACKVWPQEGGHSAEPLPAPSVDFLLAQQFSERRGIPFDHPAYGAWGFGEAKLPYGEVGHLDLSHTRRVLEALRVQSLPDAAAVWRRAKVFLGRLQQADGGFCASTYTLGANKADTHDQSGVSYATATADGVLALLALPNPPQASIRAAREWLLAHEGWSAPAGIQPGQAGDWDKVLYYYHLSVRAQAYATLTVPGNWPQNLLQELRDKQAPDGSFRNPWGGPNKEDDPLLATALVIKAINAAVGP